jgi:hypothetical protein
MYSSCQIHMLSFDFFTRSNLTAKIVYANGLPSLVIYEDNTANSSKAYNLPRFC